MQAATGQAEPAQVWRTDPSRSSKHSSFLIYLGHPRVPPYTACCCPPSTNFSECDAWIVGDGHCAHHAYRETTNQQLCRGHYICPRMSSPCLRKALERDSHEIYWKGIPMRIEQLATCDRKQCGRASQPGAPSTCSQLHDSLGRVVRSPANQAP